MTKKIIYFDENQPFLVVPAAVMLLQLESPVVIRPTSVNHLSSLNLNNDDKLYLLNLFPENNDEEVKLNRFLERYKHLIHFHSKSQAYPWQSCLNELKKSGFRLSSAWVDIAREIAINDVQTTNRKAERLIRAYQAQSALVYNSNHHYKINELILKIVDEFITGIPNREVDALAEYHRKAEKELEALLAYWNQVSLRSEKYRSPSFRGVPHIKLDQIYEINPFLNLQPFIDLIKRKSNRFVIEYNCRGRHHFIYVKDDKTARKSYSERTTSETARFRASKSLLKKI